MRKAYAEQLHRWTRQLLSFVRLHPFIAGMEISDFALRVSYFAGGKWHFEGVRLEPGILEQGIIKNRAALVSALQSLKAKAFPRRFQRRRLNLIVSLSSADIYSQTFNIPILKGDSLDRAIQLNLQMVSPIEFAKAYSGWQRIGENTALSRLEFLGAFIEKTVVDDMTRALFEAGFLAVAVESKAIALSRLVREEGLDIDATRPYLFLDVNGTGIDLLIIREGELYFDYFTEWKDIADDKGEISTTSVETTVLRNLHQIINFYGQHWQETPSEILVSSTAMLEDVEGVVRDNFQIPLREFQLRVKDGVQPEWFVALGSGLRGQQPRAKDKELSLLGVEAEKEFRREQVIGFLEFWRVLLPSIFGMMLIAFLATDRFLGESRKAILRSEFSTGRETNELKELQQRALDFNRLVRLFKGAESASMPKYLLMEKLASLAAAHNTRLNRFDFQERGASMPLAGTAASQADLTAFRDALVAEPVFKNVVLPLRSVVISPSGVEFTLTLTVL